MKIRNCYAHDSRKLCNFSGGEVVQIQYNDGKVDKELYLVLVNDMVHNEKRLSLANLGTGLVKTIHTSTRCLEFKNASLDPDPRD